MIRPPFLYLLLTAAFLHPLFSQSLDLSKEGRFWRMNFGIAPFEMDLDPDGDGLSSRAEYYAGTDPFDPRSQLEVRLTRVAPLYQLQWESQPGSRYRLFESDDLINFIPFGDIFAGTGAQLGTSLDLRPSDDNPGPRNFFALGAVSPLDQDSDGLSDREEAILGTSSDNPNTDGDLYSDSEEVFETFTDPLVFDPPGGIIRGTLRLVGSLTAPFETGTALGERTVFIDSNFNGILEDGERRTTTDSEGSYEFLALPPGLYEVRQILDQGESQTLPAEQTPRLPDRLPDELIDYTHAEEAAFPEAYGYRVVEAWPGAERFNVFPRSPEPVDPELLLLPIGVRAENPPIGNYPTSHHLSLPDGASVTVRFDETIIDKDGPDLIVAIPTQGEGRIGEEALFAIGPSEEELTEYSMVDFLGAQATRINEIDLADFPEVPFVNVIRVTSLTSGIIQPQNSDGGFGLAGFEALNFLPLNSEGRRIRITDSEIFEDQNFARFFQDLPPSILLSPLSGQAQVGEPFTFRLVANDDLGVAAVTAISNGSPTILDDETTATVIPSFPGELVITATVTDTGGQQTTESWTIIVYDEEGNLPYDPASLAESQGSGPTRIQVFSPASGEVPEADLPIIASIVAPGDDQANWSASYAPIDLVDPLDLATPDSDYVELGSGSGNVFSAPLGTFPTSSLPAGIYFLKIEAIPATGGLGTFYGQVIGVDIDPTSIRPSIEITTPEPGSTSDLVQEIRGSIRSSRPLDEWKVEYAPLDAVNLSDLSSGNEWKTLASGTDPIDDDLIALLDTSLLTNGTYVIRISVFNDLRLGRVEAVQIEVTSPAKLGRNRRIFTDLTAELHGLPVAIERVYDSLERDRVGDFGHGWSLNVADADLFEAIPDTGANLFGATPYRQGTRVYLNAPDGERIGFTFEAELGVTSLLGAIYRAKFIPDPGNPYSLQTPEGEDPFLSLKPNGEVALTFIGLPWNPDRFILGTPEGFSYFYHEKEGLTAIEDRNGNILNYSDNGITHSSGPEIIFERDENGRITSITAPGDQSWQYHYSDEGDLATVTDPSGKVTTFDYDQTNSHFLTSVTDPLGRVGLSFEYDDSGRLTAIIDEFGNREEQGWDPAAQTGFVINRNGHRTSLVYDERGNVLTATDPLGNTTTFQYQDDRHPDTITEITTPNTRIRYQLNELGLPTRTTYGDAFFADFITSYNEFGQITETTDFDGQIERLTYDGTGNLVKYTGLVRSREWGEFDYTPEGQLASRTVNERKSEYFYDATSGKLLQELGPLGYSRTYQYSPGLLLTGITDSQGEQVTFDFDGAGDRLTVTLPHGASFEQLLNENGDLVRRDANGNETTTSFSTDGTEVSRTLPNGTRVERDFDPEGNLTLITVPGGHQNRYHYDELNRETGFTDASGASSSSTYDAEGRLIAHTNRNGKKISYTYNRFGLVESETWHGEDGSIERQFTYTYNRTLITSVTDGSSTWTTGTGLNKNKPGEYQYDYAGQSSFALAMVWTNFQKEALPQIVRLNEPTSTLFEGEVRADFVGEQLSGLKARMPGGTDGSLRFRHDGNGRLTNIERFDFFSTSAYAPDPVTLTHLTYDRASELIQIRHENPDGTLIFPNSEIVITRDPAGRILTRTQPGNTTTYAYDSLDQVTSAIHSGFPDESFSYDLAGNPASGTIGPDNRLLAFGDLTFAYDAEGNIISQTNTTSGEIRSYSYDHRNQLVSVAVSSDGVAPPVVVAEYEYDFKGRMMSRIENGIKTWILYERDNAFAEFIDGSETFSRIYLYDFNQPENVLGTWTPEQGIRWHLTDQIGTVQGIVGGDGTGLHWIDYDTYGTPRDSVPNDFGPLRFAGRYFNSAAGLYENGLRHYHPGLRRFQQQDPIRHRSEEFNYYRYANNNPVSGVDPTGLTSANEYGILKSQTAIQRIGTLCRLGGSIAKTLVVVALLNGSPLPPGAGALGKPGFTPPAPPPQTICGP